jgi:peptidoglycan/xylan/chitin deacetylase (PgdA/CDA1 family)
MKKTKIIKILNLSGSGFHFITNNIFARIVSHPIILGFHQVKEKTSCLLDKRVGVINPADFKKIILYLKRLGYKFVSLEELLKTVNASQYKKVAAVTFDDGFKSIYDHAYPLMKKLKIPFTLFLTTSLLHPEKLLWLHKLYFCLDKMPRKQSNEIFAKYLDSPQIERSVIANLRKLGNTHKKGLLFEFESDIFEAADLSYARELSLIESLYLSKEELLEMIHNGMTVGLHGHKHLPLTSLNEKETKQEVFTSLEIIKMELKSDPLFYALPFGTSNNFINNIVKELGLLGILTTQAKIISDATSDISMLPRILVREGFSDFLRTLNWVYLNYIFHNIPIIFINQSAASDTSDK